MQVASGKILQQEGDVVERVLAWLPHRVNGLNNSFKRTILMGISFEHGGFNLGQKVEPRRIAAHPGAQWQKIHKAADQVFNFPSSPPRYHRPNHEIVLMSPSGQDYCQGGEKGHEWTGSVALTKGGECFGKRPGEDGRLLGRARRRRTASVNGRESGSCWRAGELGPPIGKMLLNQRPLH